jgi:hypothetical protein
VVEHVARKLEAPVADFRFYEWSGRTFERHAARHAAISVFGSASVAHAERDTDRVRVELLSRIREERIEPPADGRARWWPRPCAPRSRTGLPRS